MRRVALAAGVLLLVFSALLAGISLLFLRTA